MYFQEELTKNLEAQGDHVAIDMGDRKISYKELLATANRISSFLLKLGLEKETFVGINVKDRAEFISSMIGVMNARCVFVPIDVTLPELRLDSMIKELNLKHIISSGDPKETGFKEIESLNNYQLLDILSVTSDENTSKFQYPEYDAQDSLYVYFTSGSTGIPKGIIGRNCSLLQFIKWEIGEFELNQQTRFSQLISPYFDAFLRDVFVPLFAKGTICIPPDEETFYASDRIVSWLNTNKINLIHCVPSVFREINSDILTVDCFKHLKYVLLSGEKINPIELQHWYDLFDERIQLVNLYGTTETTMIRSYYRLSREDTHKSRIPIGFPISDTELLVSNIDFKPCNTLISGDLYILSDYVSKGYLNNPELTAGKFIKIKREGLKETIAFKTGDRARRLPSGQIELIGRADRQIKLRGVRIELDEIESILMRSKLLKNASVIVHEDKGKNESLIAFVIGKGRVSGKLGLSEELLAYSERFLPPYMIPAQVIEISEFPLLNNGKINYNGLLTHLTPQREIFLPANETEEEILSIWKELLGDKEISTNDRFHQIGGNSLTIMNLINKINKTLHVRISLSELFNNPTIQNQAEFVARSNKNNQIVIPRASVSEHYVLSSTQKRLYFLHQFDKISLAYNMPQLVKLIGKLDEERLYDALNKLVSRHESLRTSFELINDDPFQKIEEEVDLTLERYKSDENDIPSKVKEFIRPFNLQEAPLLRIGLIEISLTEHILMIDMHHIITDGVSQVILIKDFMSIYANEELPKLPLQYKDYAVWQQSGGQTQDTSRQREFWINEFVDEVEPIDLQTDFARPLVKSQTGSIVSFDIGVKETSKLSSIAKSEGATMFMVLLSIYNVLLSKLSNQENITIGTPITDRPHVDLLGTIGMFANTIVLRNSVVGELTYKEFLASVRSKTLRCFDHKDYPYEELIEIVKVERDISRNPLFDIMFSYQNFEETRLEISGLSLQPIKRERSESKFDLTLFASEEQGEIVLAMEYATALFKRESINRFITYFKQVVSTVTSKLDIKISDIELISEKEKQHILKDFNATRATYPQEDTIVSIFEKQLRKTPQNTALIFNGSEVSYLELNEMSNKIAWYLREVEGVRVGDMVGIMLERDEYLIPSIYGILKAGAAYIPIDPHYPIKRIDSILNDANLKVLLTRTNHLHKLMDSRLKVIDLDSSLSVINTQKNKSLELDISSHDLAYVIYTSGTSGQPKGVMIEHHSVVNRIFWMQKAYPIKANDVLIQKTPIVFDVSVWELFWWSFEGASLFLPEPDVERDPRKIFKAIQTNNVTTIHFVPSMLNSFLSVLGEDFNCLELPSLRQVFSSGEALKPNQVNLFGETLHKNCGVRLINLYGPTEATVDVSYYECTFDKKLDHIPIGKPIDNISLYIINNDNKVAAIGTSGELCIAGAGLSRGYLNNKELTGEKFIAHPEIKESRIYKSGDLAMWQPDGDIRYLGRIDTQVKIRGLRIEMGGIEKHLGQYDEVRGTVVLAKGKDEDKHLVAYYESEHEIEASRLRSFLAELLPEYMIPAHYVHLENFPLTPNGKIDKKALPEVEISAGPDHVAPTNEIEEALIRIWSEVLKIDEEFISVNKSFFEIGGNSLKVVKLNTIINDTFDWNLSIPDMFRYTTISSLSEFKNSKMDEQGHPTKAEEEIAGMHTSLKAFND